MDENREPSHSQIKEESFIDDESTVRLSESQSQTTEINMSQIDSSNTNKTDSNLDNIIPSPLNSNEDENNNNYIEKSVHVENV